MARARACAGDAGGVAVRAALYMDWTAAGERGTDRLSSFSRSLSPASGKNDCDAICEMDAVAVSRPVDNSISALICGMGVGCQQGRECKSMESECGAYT